MGIPARRCLKEYLGLYTVPDFGGIYDPLISIIIRTRIIRKIWTGVFSPDREKIPHTKIMKYIIVENNSTEEETFEYYKKLEPRKPQTG